MATDPQVTIVLPTLEERPSFELLHPRLSRALAPYEAEVIIVDDDSRDGIETLVRGLTPPPTYRIIERHGTRGLASAVVEGLRTAHGRVAVVMDADGSHPPELLPSLIDPVISDRAAFVLASRSTPGGSSPGLLGYRRLVTWAATTLARPLTGVSDPMSGFFAVRRSCLELDRLAPIGYKIALEVLVKCHPAPVLEVPFEFAPRLAGKSKLGGRQMGHYLHHLGRLYAWRFWGAGRAESTR